MKQHCKKVKQGCEKVKQYMEKVKWCLEKVKPAVDDCKNFLSKAKEGKICREDIKTLRGKDAAHFFVWATQCCWAGGLVILIA